MIFLFLYRRYMKLFNNTGRPFTYTQPQRKNHTKNIETEKPGEHGGEQSSGDPTNDQSSSRSPENRYSCSNYS